MGEPTKKYILRSNHYIREQYVEASPERPAIVELTDKEAKLDAASGKPKDRGLELYAGGPVVAQEVGKHFVPTRTSSQSAAERFDAPPAPAEPPKAVELQPEKSRGKR